MRPPRPRQRTSRQQDRHGAQTEKSPANAPAGAAHDRPESLIEEAAQLDEEERDRLDGETPALPSVRPAAGPEDLRTAIAQAKRAQELARRREANHTEARAALDQQRSDLERRFADDRAALTKQLAEERNVQEQRLADERAELQRRTAALEQHQTDFDKQAAELAERMIAARERDDRLFHREQEEQAGFAQYRHEHLRRLEAELDQRRRAGQAAQEQRDDEAAARRGAAEEKLAERVADLDERALALDERDRSLRLLQRRLRAREESLENAADDARREAEHRAAADLQVAQQEAQSWRQRYDLIRDLADRRASQLSELEAATMATGNRPLPEVEAELAQVRRDYEELRRQIAGRGQATPERLAETEARCQDLEAEREDLLRQNEELRRTVAATRITVAERENARTINQALQQLNGVLQQEIESHTATLERLQASSTQDPPFPACSAMDADERYQTDPEMQRGMPALEPFVDRVRSLIALRFGLYYTARDLRCFVGGLAASHLHLLEGISGTGKTRLPLVFAETIGARCDTVAVAADWRSPQDLLGYYNAFERRFYESEFTKALYRAQLPMYAQKPFFILLDEMNLSHPEQYFSSVLAALGNDDPTLQRLPLMSSRVDPAPERLIEGQYLSVPPNVWFVGTANHDETTVRFADKTYDRSHVLELPVQPEPFDVGQPPPLTPISLEALHRSFDRAAGEFADDAEHVLTYLNGELGHRFRHGLKVSWGNRLGQQARAFVPVVRAAGGTIGEAADHLIATKVLSKLHGRVDLRSAELRALLQQLQDSWDRLCGDSLPEQSVAVLEETLRDKAFG